MNQTDYLSETELADLIKSAESDLSYKAPAYLKEQILQKTAGKTAPKSKNSFLFFSIKVAAGAAASIALLFGMPDMASPRQYSAATDALYEKDPMLLEQFNQKTNQILRLLSDTVNSIFIKEDKNDK